MKRLPPEYRFKTDAQRRIQTGLFQAGKPPVDFQKHRAVMDAQNQIYVDGVRWCQGLDFAAAIERRRATDDWAARCRQLLDELTPKPSGVSDDGVTSQIEEVLPCPIPTTKVLARE